MIRRSKSLIIKPNTQDEEELNQLKPELVIMEEDPIRCFTISKSQKEELKRTTSIINVTSLRKPVT